MKSGYYASCPPHLTASCTLLPTLNREASIEEKLPRQIRQLQVCVLFVSTVLLILNAVHPVQTRQRCKILEVERINIREKTGILKAALSNSAGVNELQRAERGGVRFSGLMFYNEEGQEEGGLVYSGKAAPNGQDADVPLTMSFWA